MTAKGSFWVAIAAVLGCAVTSYAAEPLKLANDGRTEFTIVLADDASPSTRYAASELQRFLKEITGAEFAIRPDKEPLSAREIVLGDNAHLRQLGVSIDFAKLGREGYVIRTVGSHLVIAGGALRGNLYGVYGLLEDHLGCRWFTPAVSRIPKHKLLTLRPIDETKIPALEYREPFTIDCFDGDWCARNRMNSSTGRLEEKHGGKVRFGSGLFVHSFNVLMPPEKYFDAHPEYFSEIDGKRTNVHTQLCCTNEDVIRICTEELRKRIQADPDAYVYSVSQNDWGNACQCAKCQALAKAEDSQMAPVLALVNRVAEAVEKEFPDKAIETLAYQWTRKPPKTMRPRPNVIIRLCSIECCFMHPLATCDAPENRAFVHDLEGWATVANRLWIWDYVTSFNHFLCPFPNLHVRDDNIRLFIKNHVTGVFEQDDYVSMNGELSPLSGYLGAKFLWNPDYGKDAALNEFLDGVYGKGAKPIRKYIDLLRERVEKKNIHAHIWVGPNVPYLDDKLLAKADALWEKAERRVASEPEVLERVRIARLCVDYAIIERERFGDLGGYFLDKRTLEVKPCPAFAARVKKFFDIAQRAQVTRMAEATNTLEEYRANFAGIFDGTVKTLRCNEAVTGKDTVPGLTYSYYETDAEWTRLPNFDSLTPVKTGCAEQFGIAPSDRKQSFGLRFTGFVKAPRDGVYRFYTNSNDGSRLYIGSDLVVDNDGQHGAQEKVGFAALKAGLHPITVIYFQAGGASNFEVRYAGPGIKKTMIPATALSHAK